MDPERPITNPDENVPLVLSIGVAVLQRNFSAFRGGYPSDLPADSDRYINAPVTHTFPATKVWGEAPEQNIEVYQQVLFEDRALISDKARERLGKFLPGEPRRDARAWRAAGLDQFVTGYLGIHDPYYSRDPLDTNSPGGRPAFGLYFGRECEAFPACVATRRDLEALGAGKDVDQEFLLAAHARELACCEWSAGPDHGGDFWHYYGAPEHWTPNPRYVLEMWKWKYEFHYLDRLALDEVRAVLWPTVYYEDPVTGGRVPSYSTQMASQFRREWPTCAVLEYDWSPVDPMEFVRASYDVARYFIRFGAYPSTLFDARELLRD